ncbi:Hsp20/alpha crystallin family protein [Pseudomaricurvus alkylphenolicus]|jgi:HSP20 family protein|uniref:Hsp20/alpha crystallin family protein n=1 Tax=Pseudomaricurvus alkylphenolicus TaxID=1306991 RepID=UPI001423DE91|nr:Hsp20/alpha crystallin family protein [Pseudomaricurvus alkylphenolicus]NIB41644.1 Hsp20/alpha crystallin family protein [Pseudomaricurvus alkylphenolicus]
MSLIPRDSLLNFEHMFDNFFTPSRFMSEQGEGFFSPRVDIRENDKTYMVSAELPGVKKDDLTVTLRDGVLTVEAELHQEDKEEKDGKLLRQERRYGRFMRSFNLMGDVKEKDIDATFKDGILHLTVPKREPKAPQSRRIEVH